MSFQLTVDLPNIGEQEIYIHGLGSFGNGTHEITDEQAEQFRVINSRTGYGEMNDEGTYSLDSSLGPDLETAGSSMYGVTIVPVHNKPNTDNTSNTGTKQPVDSGGTPDGTGSPRTETSGGE